MMARVAIQSNLLFRAEKILEGVKNAAGTYNYSDILETANELSEVVAESK